MERNNEHVQNLLKLAAENPELPIVPFVDSEIVFDDSYARWLAAFGEASVGEYACYKERYFDDRDDFKEYYYDHNSEELSSKFNYHPLTDNSGEDQLEKYLDKVAEEYFTKAILVNIDLL